MTLVQGGSVCLKGRVQEMGLYVSSWAFVGRSVGVQKVVFDKAGSVLRLIHLSASCVFCFYKLMQCNKLVSCSFISFTLV